MQYKRIIYTVGNSNAMNGVSADNEIVEVRAWWQTAIVVLDVVFGLLAALSIFMLVKYIRKSKATQE